MFLCILSGFLGGLISMTSKILTKKTIDLDQINLYSIFSFLIVFLFEFIGDLF